MRGGYEVKEVTQVTIDGRVSRVQIDPDGPEGLLRVRVDGRERLIDARALGGGAWSLLEREPPAPGAPAPAEPAAAGGGAGGGPVPARARLVRVDGPLSRLTVQVGHPDGEPRTVVLSVAPSRGAGHGDGAGAGDAPGPASEREATGPVTLRAPIPGKIVKIAVRVGDRVTAGQALLVLEAMKMENEIRSPRDGLVKAILVQEGVSVDGGQELVSVAS